MEVEIKQECLAIEQLKQLLRQSSEKVLVIDVRSAEEYASQHIPAAVNIPLDRLEETVRMFGKEKVYITACGKGGGRSAAGAQKLQKSGFNATYLCGGTFGWFEIA